MRLIDADALIAQIEAETNELVDRTEYQFAAYVAIHEVNNAPTIEPERKTGCLTEDEIKTIRIHMNAFKERLCNQHRWKEAEEYQQIVDKLDVMLPQPEQRWTPVTQLPELDEDGESEMLLLSFSNFSLPTIGEYRVTDGEGHWYDGDDDKPLEDYGLKVNAWMKLPEMYREEEE